MWIIGSAAAGFICALWHPWETLPAASKPMFRIEKVNFSSSPYSKQIILLGKQSGFKSPTTAAAPPPPQSLAANTTGNYPLCIVWMGKNDQFQGYSNGASFGCFRLFLSIFRNTAFWAIKDGKKWAFIGLKRPDNTLISTTHGSSSSICFHRPRGGCCDLLLRWWWERETHNWMGETLIVGLE